MTPGPMRYLPHEWGPDPDRPGFTVCLWCRRPFGEVGGTRCEVDDIARADTSPMPIAREAPTPPPRLYWPAVALLVLTFTALLVLAVADTST